MATTYNDQKSALDALTNSLVFENATRAITGTGHNAQELGQNSSAFDNLVAYDNYAYKVVRTYATATENGQSLKDAYEDAKTLTPSGAALATNNRVALLIPPGAYSFGTDGLELDTQFIDLIGVGKAEETILTSVSNTATGLGTIIQRTNDIIFKNLTIQNTANTFNTGTDQDDSGYAPQNVFPSVRFEDCIFRNPAVSGGAPFMRLGFEYSGTFIRCRGIDATGNSVFFPIASGNYFDCHYAGNGFGYGGEASGIFTDCSCVNGFGYAGDASGSFTRCTAFGSGFGTDAFASGSFNYCRALTRSFGWGDGIFATGSFTYCSGDSDSFGCSSSGATFIGCRGGDNCFGSYEAIAEARIAGTYDDCIAGDGSFFGTLSANAFPTEISGTFTGCRAGVRSFGSSGTITFGGTARNCSAGDESFCGVAGDGFDGAILENCSAGNNSFGQLGATISDTTMVNCTAGDDSFGGDQSAIVGSVFKNCKAGDRSFGYAVFPGVPSSIENTLWEGCIGGDDCWAYHSYNDSQSKIIGCSGGERCFLADTTSASVYQGCYATSGFSGNFTSGAIVKDCHASDNGFRGNFLSGAEFTGCSAGSGFSGSLLASTFVRCSVSFSGFNQAGSGDTDADMSAVFIDCSAGDNSFGYNNKTPLGSETLTITSTFTNCKAGDNSFGVTAGNNLSIAFAGKAYNCSAGNFSFCTAVETPAAGSHTEVLSGYMENCHAGVGGFAAHSTSSKTGTLSGCSVRTNGSPASFADAGPLTGTMTNCQWTVAPASTASLIVATGAKVYGGLYRAGAGATAGITSSGAVTVSIANILTNAPLGGSITNNISSPNVIVDSDI